MTQGARRFDDLYNAADDLIGRNLNAGRGSKTAFIDANGSWTYQDVETLSNRFANAILDAGIRAEDRLIMCRTDTVDFVAVFLGSIKAGVMPVPLNTRLTPDDYSYMLDDSRATALLVTEALLPQFESHLASHEGLQKVIVSGNDGQGHALLSDMMGDASDKFETVASRRDDMCFWLYTSGTTGKPKGAIHRHGSLIESADLFGIPTLELTESDTVYSAAKLFFAYGLGNALTFPMAAGATTILLDGPPDATAVSKIIKTQNPTVFYGVPTLYGMLLASGELPEKTEHGLRLCTSAGEALPPDLLRRWVDAMGVQIIDGIGTTEMLHIFLSNSLADMREGTTGKPVPGYTLRLVDDEGLEVPNGEMGTLEVSGPTAALMYWNQRAKSLETFRGPWTRTGDKYTVDEDGYFVYAGRTDDMLKVGGIYVSPFEVEAAIGTHPAVLEAAVVGRADQDNLIKPEAFVVLNDGFSASDTLAKEMIDHVAQSLAGFKRPRWVSFVSDLPKTATGKIQRFKLRS